MVYCSRAGYAHVLHLQEEEWRVLLELRRFRLRYPSVAAVQHLDGLRRLEK